MNHYIITPVGTSLIRSNQPNDPILPAMRNKSSDDEIVRVNMKKYKQHFLDIVKDNPKKSCAEINSISLFLEKYPTDHTTVSLIPTDTAESYLACLILTEYFESIGYKVVKHIVRGLSYSDPKTFRRKGLKNLIEQVKSEVITAKKEKTNPVINATAGFKAESAILLLLAQLLGLDVFYAHELMKNDIVIFPRLPVTLDPAFWGMWKPIVQAVIDADNTATGIMPVSQFRELTKYVDLGHGRILFDVDEDFGGVLLSTMGLLLANSFQLESTDIHIADSGIEESRRINLNEREMSHAPKGSRGFIEKLSGLSFIKRIRNEKFVNTVYSRVKPKYDSRDSNEIRVIYSDGKKGLELVVLTTARNEVENFQAKRLLAEYININIQLDENDDDSLLFVPGQLLDNQFGDEITSMGEKIEKAEEIIQQGDKITQPYIEAVERERNKAKKHRKDKEDVEKQLRNARQKIQALKEELASYEE